MARRAAAALVLAAALSGNAGVAHAQGLARLTVQSFVLAADTANPKVDEPFHLILTLRVRERVGEITNVDLPMLAQLELLGDERATMSTPRGTQYRETITVVARQAGTIAIAPATLQAVDARDGKAKEWYTNGLSLRVTGAAPQAFRNGAQMLLRVAIAAAWVLLWLIGFGVVVLILVAVFRGRRKPVPVVVVPSPPTPRPALERTHRQQAEDALAVLRTERSRAAAVAVRAAIWRMAGASDGETLGDVLRRPESRGQTMRHLLIALERSAFTYEADLRGAIDDACAALERYIGEAA